MTILETLYYQLSHRHRIDGLPILFVSQLVRGVAFVFLGLFSPLYIFGIGQDLGFTTSKTLALTFFFFWLIYFAKLVCLPLAENFSIKFGFKNLILFSIVPFFLFLPLLVLSKDYPFLLPFAAVAWGIYDALFWWGYHGFFVGSGDPSYFGKAIGVLSLFSTIVVVASPILGALVVEAFGFRSLFVAAGVGKVLSLMLLLPAGVHKPKIDIRLDKTLKLMWRHRKMALSYVGYGAETSVLGTVWPVFLFITLGKTLEVGGVVSAAAFAAAAMTFLVGAWIDKKGIRGNKQLIAVGSPLIATTWFIRAFSRGIPALIGIDAAYRFVGQLVWLPLDLLSYRKATEGGGVNQAMMFRQIGITVGPLIIISILIVWTVLGGGLAAFFLLPALVSLLPLSAIRRE